MKTQGEIGSYKNVLIIKSLKFRRKLNIFGHSPKFKITIAHILTGRLRGNGLVRPKSRSHYARHDVVRRGTGKKLKYSYK